ncbi:Fe(3+)-hydroxamate ABC transporter permease FhuB [Brucella sp. NBRC 12950]|uniref:Fe(3+)-hydroxamate ABC transporter permease FhuB n=1 Tax=Brucella sp. NBRC 12950 TaxID=2994518 RepID=UPI0024A3BB09|nr:Fe(3+)-hydroxamate ABC transporter permease FhuB [Brucella sp. NBRC 12950]GLU27475.1 Fe3+-hydroxamate ABC transporter permease FhuB [Brucella sp. NBRC 12950]
MPKATSTAASQPETPRNKSIALGSSLIVLGLVLFALNLRQSGAWPVTIRAMFIPDDARLTEMLVHYGYLPRVMVAILAGLLLGLCTTLLQQVLSNPLAEPGTLGIFSASRLAVAMTILFLPLAANSGFILPSLIGSSIALAIILLLTRAERFAPLRIVLYGMVLSLCFEAVTAMLLIAHFEDLGELIVWQSGSLSQNSWHVTLLLLGSVLALTSVAFLLLRPLTAMGVDEKVATSLGSSPKLIRGIALVAAVVGSAIVVAACGVIAFIGLGGAAIAQFSGARRFQDRLIAAPLIAAGLLVTTDQLMVFLLPSIDIPAGSVTAVIGAPLLLIILRKSRSLGVQISTLTSAASINRPDYGFLIVSLFALPALMILVLFIGRNPEGWYILTPSEWRSYFDWRVPRTIAAAASGAMLATSGCLMQRMTGNPMASPELLGVSSGAALLMIPVVLFLPPLGRSETIIIAALGSIFFLSLSLRLTARSGFSPERLLMTGIAITALSGSVMSIVIFLGDMRLTRLLGWMSGSLYSVRMSDALIASAICLTGLCMALLQQRWIEILPLGQQVSRSLGLRLSRARLLIILLTGIMTGTSILLIGPISFIGLLAPHIARLTGQQRPVPFLLASAMLGAAILTLADWVGRYVAFPWEIPAGLIATFVGGFFVCAVAGRR